MMSRKRDRQKQQEEQEEQGEQEEQCEQEKQLEQEEQEVLKAQEEQAKRCFVGAGEIVGTVGSGDVDVSKCFGPFLAIFGVQQ